MKDREIFNTLGSWKSAVVITLWMLLILMPAIWNLPLLDRDEPRFSRATVEMIERGDWIVPRFNGDYRFDKPPLTYWWMAIHYFLFGQNELGARLHSVVASIGVGLVLFFWVRRTFGARTAWGVVFGWSICLQNLMHGRLALADMPMVWMVLVTHWLLWQKIQRADSSGYDAYFWGIYGSMGIGFLAKGPVAVLFPMISLLIYAFVFRQSVDWSRLKLVSGGAICLLMIAAWGLPALITTDGAYWDEGIGTHVIDRGIKTFNKRMIIPGYYIPTSALSLFPIFPLVLVGVCQAVRRRQSLDAWLLSWAIGPFLVFSFYATQLIHYTLPAFPALMILAFQSQVTGRWRWVSRIYNLVFASLAIVSVIAGIALMIWTPGPAAPEFASSARDLFAPYLMGVGIIILSISGMWTCWNHSNGWIGTWVCAVVLGATMIFLGTHSQKWGLSRQIGQDIQHLPESIQPIAIGYREPSLVFYGRRQWDLTKSDTWSDPGPQSVVVIKTFELQIEDFTKGIFLGFADIRGETIPDSPLQRAVQAHRVDPSSPARITFIQGLNFARMSWVEVAIIREDNGI